MENLKPYDSGRDRLPEPDAGRSIFHRGLWRVSQIQRALFLTVMIGLTIPTIGALVAERHFAVNQAQIELERDLHRHAKVLALALEAPLWEISRTGADAILHAMTGDERIVSVTVQEIGSPLEFASITRLAGAIEGEISHEEPVVHGNQKIGQVRVTMTLAPYLEVSRLRFWRMLGLIIMTFVIELVAITLILRYRIVQPIEQLTEDAKRLADQDMSRPISVGNDSEIGRVAAAMEYLRCRLLEAFNELQLKNDQLQHHAESLELRVQDRTRELEKTLKTLKIAQTGLVEAEKQASLGRLVAGVAHELNTPIGNALTAISTVEDLDEEILKVIKEGQVSRSTLIAMVARAREGHAITQNNIRRAADIIRHFKQLAIDQTTEAWRCFDLCQLVQEVLLSLQPEFRRASVSIRSELAPDIVMEGFPGPLGQVLTNLLQNAVQHGFEGKNSGTILITSERLPDNQVRLTIADDGVGMCAEVLEKIFDPFFTTKMGRGGTGLGMHIVHSIVAGLLCGSISVHSRAEQGSRFDLRIPMVLSSNEQQGTLHR